MSGLSLHDRVLSVAVGVLAVCAVLMTAALVRREIRAERADRAPPAVTIPDYRAFAVGRVLGGPNDAPVTIVTFSDFQCPICARVASTLSAILAAYPDRVRVVYRHWTLDRIHPYAREAAIAAECAAEQGRFARFHDHVYARQDSLGPIPWVRLAVASGVPDTVAFNRCLVSVAPEARLERDRRDGVRLGVEGTPTMLVNGLVVRGALSRLQFDSIVRGVDPRTNGR